LFGITTLLLLNLTLSRSPALSFASFKSLQLS
jgi:hypothetical protein